MPLTSQSTNCWKTWSFSPMNAPWFYSGSRPTVGFQAMKEHITWLRQGANNHNPCSLLLTREPKPCSKTAQNVNGKEPLEIKPLYWLNQPSGKTWTDHYIQVANRTLRPASTPEANWCVCVWERGRERERWWALLIRMAQLFLKMDA